LLTPPIDGTQTAAGARRIGLETARVISDASSCLPDGIRLAGLGRKDG
jgi:hypothetical protein